MTSPGGWWPDPSGRHQYRYWDGAAWTEHVADDGVGATDPVDAPDPPVRVPAPRPAPRPGPGPGPRPPVPGVALSDHALRRVIPTPDPDPTDVYPRRIVAFLVDAAVCVAAAVFLITLLAPGYTRDEANDRFSCAPSSNGFFDPSTCDRPTFVEIGNQSYDVTAGLAPVRLLAAFAAFTFVYWALAEQLFGATPGKWIAGLRVVDLQGRRAGLGRTTIRWLLLAVDGPLTVFICGLITSTTTNGHQRLGDRWSDTYVIGKVDAGKPLTLPE